MNKKYVILLIILLAGLIGYQGALAQDESELVLNINRDIGYSSGSGRIQGRFTLKASGPEDLQKVEFWIDREIMAEDSQAPFSYQFHTGDYTLGVHTMSARGFTQDGRVLLSNEIRNEFVSTDEGWQTASRIAIPILAISLAALLLSTALPALSRRGKKSSIPPGAPRSYGLLGGAICPKCARPFGVHIWGMNVLIGKLDRCPHCGKWSLVVRASWEALKAAEAAELETSEPSQPDEPLQAEKESLQKELDDSKYLDF